MAGCRLGLMELAEEKQRGGANLTIDGGWLLM
jgi:hypothetical protein